MDFKLPDIGEGVQEGELIKWLVKEGDTVSVDQAVLEVMTDKATVEIPATGSGVIKGISAKEGQMIKVGQVLATIEEGAGGAKAPAAPATSPQIAAPNAPQAAAPTPAAPAPQNATQAPAPQAAAQNATQAATAPAPQAASAPQAPAAQKVPAPAQPSNGSAPQAVTATGPQATNYASGVGAYRGALESHTATNVAAAPIVRAMAQKAGVDLSQVQGSGPEVGGRPRVLEEDLVRFLESQHAMPGQVPQSPAPGAANAPSLPARPVAGSNDVERKPLRGLRRVIAQAMVKSKYTAPHYSYVDEYECSELVKLREVTKKYGEQKGVKISYLAFIVKAVVQALKEFPIVNASLEEGANGSEIVYKKFYNIGVAVATPDGLVVPVVKHADQKSILEIAAEIQHLADKVRSGKAAPDDLKGSTFSITSMGNIGGLFGMPIINYPEVGIMGVYKIQEKPLVKNGEIVIGKTMHLSFSFDHRVVDGAVGGEFCNAIMSRLENPAKLLIDLA